ncbi:MAG TPA: DUF2285 domain-containing protein [Dongiaceae bacterium]|nr:DUF2285 domain-containing protein [Dongiaceae bacterium]
MRASEASLRLPHEGCEATILRLGQDEHLLLRRTSHSVQLICKGAAVQAGKEYRVSYDLPGFDAACDSKLRSLKCFEQLYRCPHLSRTLFFPTSRSRRLRLILQALDGHLAGASYREIAITLLGEKRVQEDWPPANRCLFDQTYRLVQRGLYLRTNWNERHVTATMRMLCIF